MPLGSSLRALCWIVALLVASAAPLRAQTASSPDDDLAPFLRIVVLEETLVSGDEASSNRVLDYLLGLNDAVSVQVIRPARSSQPIDLKLPGKAMAMREAIHDSILGRPLRNAKASLNSALLGVASALQNHSEDDGGYLRTVECMRDPACFSRRSIVEILVLGRAFHDDGVIDLTQQVPSLECFGVVNSPFRSVTDHKIRPNRIRVGNDLTDQRIRFAIGVDSKRGQEFDVRPRVVEFFARLAEYHNAQWRGVWTIGDQAKEPRYAQLKLPQGGDCTAIPAGAPGAAPPSYTPKPVSTPNEVGVVQLPLPQPTAPSPPNGPQTPPAPNAPSAAPTLGGGTSTNPPAPPAQPPALGTSGQSNPSGPPMGPASPNQPAKPPAPIATPSAPPEAPSPDLPGRPNSPSVPPVAPTPSPIPVPAPVPIQPPRPAPPPPPQDGSVGQQSQPTVTPKPPAQPPAKPPARQPAAPAPSIPAPAPAVPATPPSQPTGPSPQPLSPIEVPLPQPAPRSPRPNILPTNPAGGTARQSPPAPPIPLLQSLPVGENQLRVVVRLPRPVGFTIASATPILSILGGGQVSTVDGVTFDTGADVDDRQMATSARFAISRQSAVDHQLTLLLDGRCAPNHPDLVVRVIIQPHSGLPVLVLLNGRRVEPPLHVSINVTCRDGMPTIAPNQSLIVRTRP